ncbi:cytochrome c oxidase subunit II [Noviherbaspirillum pedocola]|uniref:cytochrome-c oxidase n=1 Tax=Noviherbaspirillum pedocola TaxID=2801341 RepID=A0A934W2G0_9BURK|nr:cytochrome c oxidase subunit II [Noviherbaspirillum pedocola]MBK4736286.1 cytochrome c oxidase subunit II [Noviherbaspirillum pedocola]
MKRALPLLLQLAALGVQAASFQSALEPAGPQAEHVHRLWHLTLGLCTVVFAAVLAALLIAIWRAPRSNATTPADAGALSRPEPRVQRNIIIALGASIAGLFVLIVADYRTDRALMRLPLNDAVHIEMTAHQWWWEARYDDADASKIFNTANELHIPVGRPVIITLKASDVIHTFWLPNLAGKKDMIPGRTALIQFRADKAGTYRGQCAEFCGFEHALMAFEVVAEPNDRYESWADGQRREAGNVLNASQSHGRQVFMERSCVMCHTIQGIGANASFGPDLTHMASRGLLAAGAIPNERQRLAAWIVSPQTIKPGTNMPPTDLSVQDLNALLDYLATLR